MSSIYTPHRIERVIDSITIYLVKYLFFKLSRRADLRSMKRCYDTFFDSSTPEGIIYRKSRITDGYLGAGG